MKTPSFLELKSLVECLTEELHDAQLQEVIPYEDELLLGFYRFTQEPKMFYLVLDMDRPFPFLGILYQLPKNRAKKTKPVALFLSAHARNHRFNRIEINEEQGRVVHLYLGEGESSCHLEYRMIPRQSNLIVTTQGKSISWYQVRELPPHQPITVSAEEEVRSLAFMIAQWSLRKGFANQSARESQAPAQMTPYEKWKRNKEKDLKKKQAALEKIQAQIEQYHNEEWQEVGEYIKHYGLKSLKPEWSVYVDFTKSRSENMQICFEKAKAAKNKVVGANDRLVLLQEEIGGLQDLSESKFEEHLKQIAHIQKSASPVREVAGRLRKHVLVDSGLTSYMGKSAADNMNLLKKSKPHDYWLHLKDYPSAHAIIHRNKTQPVSDANLREVGQWLVKEGLASKASVGVKYAVVIVECRFVKPLKGDKLGRVTYHNAREILIAV